MLLLDARTALKTRHPQPVETTLTSRYVGPMAATANQVAAALRDHLPHLEGPKLHRLLYYVQGHHLALTGRLAFPETVIAGPDGPEVDGFHDQHLNHLRGILDDWILNVVLVVATRYGQLTTGDLNRLTQAQPPWRDTPPKQPINPNMLAAFFTGDGAQEAFGPPLDPAERRRLAAEVRRVQTSPPAEPDDLAALLAKVAGHGQR